MPVLSVDLGSVAAEVGATPHELLTALGGGADAAPVHCIEPDEGHTAAGGASAAPPGGGGSARGPGGAPHVGTPLTLGFWTGDGVPSRGTAGGGSEVGGPSGVKPDALSAAVTAAFGGGAGGGGGASAVPDIMDGFAIPVAIRMDTDAAVLPQDEATLYPAHDVEVGAASESFDGGPGGGGGGGGGSLPWGVFSTPGRGGGRAHHPPPSASPSMLPWAASPAVTSLLHEATPLLGVNPSLETPKQSGLHVGSASAGTAYLSLRAPSLLMGATPVGGGVGTSPSVSVGGVSCGGGGTEVRLALPNAGAIGQGEALLLPVTNAEDQLESMVVVVPPAAALEAAADDGGVSCGGGGGGGDVGASHGTDVHAPQTLSGLGGGLLHDTFPELPNMPALQEFDASLHVETDGGAQNVKIVVDVKSTLSIAGYLILLVAIVSTSSQGCAVLWIPAVPGLVVAAWLAQSSTLLLAPLALYQWLTVSPEEKALVLTPRTGALVVAASTSQILWAGGFFLGVDYTTLSHAWLMNNAHAVLMILALVVAGQKVSRGEKLGVVIAALGGLLMQAPSTEGSLYGDAAALFGSGFAILYLSLCKRLRSRMPLFLMMAAINALNVVGFSVAAVAFTGADFSFTDKGAIGWLRLERLGFGVYLGVVIGLLGAVTAIAALKYLPAVVVGVAQQLMPIVGTTLAVGLGVSAPPDKLSMAGGLVLLGGTLIVADATRKREMSFNISDQHVRLVSVPATPANGTYGGVGEARAPPPLALPPPRRAGKSC